MATILSQYYAMCGILLISVSRPHSYTSWACYESISRTVGQTGISGCHLLSLSGRSRLFLILALPCSVARSPTSLITRHRRSGARMAELRCLARDHFLFHSTLATFFEVCADNAFSHSDRAPSLSLSFSPLGLDVSTHTHTGFFTIVLDVPATNRETASAVTYNLYVLYKPILNSII